jgi:hypothetical protein
MEPILKLATYTISSLNQSDSLLESYGLVTIRADTGVLNSDGHFESVPLDILSSAVQLKTMWSACSNPVAIVFREMKLDWYIVIPTDKTLREWQILNLPGADHMLYRARALAEKAIRGDFDISDAVVIEGSGKSS